MHPLEVTDSSFQKEVLESTQLTVVDFWAPWCGPCRMIAPIVEELAGEYSGKVKFVKVNTDDNQQAPGRYGVRGIPTLGFFLNGRLVDTVVGALPKSALKSTVEKNLVATSLN
jgi:thioredoxin 1